MDNTQYVINTVRKDIIDNNLKVKAIIQVSSFNINCMIDLAEYLPKDYFTGYK